MGIWCQQAKKGFIDFSDIQLATSASMLVKNTLSASKKEESF